MKSQGSLGANISCNIYLSSLGTLAGKTFCTAALLGEILPELAPLDETPDPIEVYGDRGVVPANVDAAGVAVENDKIIPRRFHGWIHNNM